MNDEQCIKLINKIEERQSQMATKDDVAQLPDEVHNGFDQVTSRLDDDDTERAATGSRVDRHESWIHQLADNTQTKLV